VEEARNAQNDKMRGRGNCGRFDPRGYLSIALQHNRAQSKSTNFKSRDQRRPPPNAGNIASAASISNFAGAKEACWL
jgi:hypothetical protein